MHSEYILTDSDHLPSLRVFSLSSPFMLPALNGVEVQRGRRRQDSDVESFHHSFIPSALSHFLAALRCPSSLDLSTDDVAKIYHHPRNAKLQPTEKV